MEFDGIPIHPFFDSPGINEGGSMYFRLLNANESIPDLERFIFTYFGIQNFEATIVAVATYIDTPIIFAYNPSKVSYHSYSKLLIITTTIQIALYPDIFY